MQNLLLENLLEMEQYSEQPTWVVNFQELRFQERLASGSFGVVFMGTYQASPVAIKVCLYSFSHIIGSSNPRRYGQ
jgi:hypothetical protein